MSKNRIEERKFRDPDNSIKPRNDIWFTNRMDVVPKSHWRKRNWKIKKRK